MIKLTPELRKKIEAKGKKIIPISLQELNKAKKIKKKNYDKL
jgi:hypothetical protein